MHLTMLQNLINRLGTWLCLVIVPSLLSAQEDLRLSFHSLSTDEGLSQATNENVFLDSRGLIWLSSLEGLNRFDGQNVRTYKSVPGDTTSLLDNIVTSRVFEDARGNLWFTTYEGLHCYLRDHDEFRQFQLPNADSVRQRKDYKAIHLDAAGNFWLRVGIDSVGYLHRFNTKTFEDTILTTIDGHRNFPILDESGELIQIACSQFNPPKRGIELIDVFPPYRQQLFFERNSTALEECVVYDIEAIGPTNWYLGTRKGLFIFDPEKLYLAEFLDYQGQEIGAVNACLNLNETTLLVASEKAGVLVFDKLQQRFSGSIPFEPNRSYGLAFQAVSKMYLDHQNQLWLSSHADGVAFAHLEKRKFRLDGRFLNRDVNVFFESSTGDVFCTYGPSQIAFFPSGANDFQIAEIASDQPTDITNISHFYEDETGTVWGISEDKLMRWDSTNFRFQHTADLPAQIMGLYRRPNGQVILGTYDSIFLIDNKLDGLPSILPFARLGAYQKGYFKQIYEDENGLIYLAHDGTELLIFDCSDPNSDCQLEEQIEGTGYITSMVRQGDLLWITASSGLTRFNLRDRSRQILTDAEGIPNDYYYCALPDDEGQLWLSGNQGVIRYDPIAQTHHRFTMADGLQGNEFNENGYLLTSSGEMWLGGTAGLNRFFPDQIQALQLAPKVAFTRLLVNDEPYTTDPQISELESITLRYRENTLSLSFVALDFSDPERTSLQYQLENHEDNWVEVTGDGFARYSNLPPGNYLFKVRAANSDGVWNELPQVLAITIRTPFWKSKWFYAAVFLVIVGLIYGGFTYRLQQALRFERLRVKISSDLHDDVGGLLSGLAMQSEILELTAPEDQKPKLSRISELSRSAMSRMRDTVWAIDARKDKLESILDRIQEHAAEILDPKGIQLDLRVDGLDLTRNMNAQVRQNLYLICKEAMTNTAKYSNGNLMHISFAAHGRKGMELVIWDNGKVVPKKHKSSGLGMSNMEMRSKQIGGHFSLDIEDGFQIKVVIPQ